MPKAYKFKVDLDEKIQSSQDFSFIGGKPKLPENIEMPKCRLCGSEQTFFFQIAFPDNHDWAGFSMAFFACTACANEKYLIPEMLKGQLKDIDIPTNFLDDYQKNFKIIVFRTEQGIIKNEYQEKIVFRKWIQEETDNSEDSGAKIGGLPNWVLEDEAPKTYASKIDMFFIMQIPEKYKFDILPDAPKQLRIGLTGKAEPLRLPIYRLFLENAIYFFGTKDDNERKVYIVTQT